MTVAIKTQIVMMSSLMNLSKMGGKFIAMQTTQNETFGKMLSVAMQSISYS
jgi:hypothetical protein